MSTLLTIILVVGAVGTLALCLYLIINRRKAKDQVREAVKPVSEIVTQVKDRLQQ